MLPARLLAPEESELQALVELVRLLRLPCLGHGRLHRPPLRGTIQREAVHEVLAGLQVECVLLDVAPPDQEEEGVPEEPEQRRHVVHQVGCHEVHEGDRLEVDRGLEAYLLQLDENHVVAVEVARRELLHRVQDDLERGLYLNLRIYLLQHPLELENLENLLEEDKVLRQVEVNLRLHEGENLQTREEPEYDEYYQVLAEVADAQRDPFQEKPQLDYHYSPEIPSHLLQVLNFFFYFSQKKSKYKKTRRLHDKSVAGKKKEK